MKIQRILAATLVALAPLAASAASFIIPIAGSTRGANDSRWQTELVLHSSSSTTIHARLLFHDRTGTTATAEVDVAPRATLSIADVVNSRFGLENVTGAIELQVDDRAARKLVITSRTFSRSERGDLGESIPAVRADNASKPGASLVIAAPSSASDFRLNVGLYAVSNASVRWDLVRADGSTASSRTLQYIAGTQTQYNPSSQALFDTPSEDNDSVIVSILSGSIVAYGSSVANATGDPTYIPAIATDSDINIPFLGIESGLTSGVSIADADHDGVLDRELPLHSGPWPNSFRILIGNTGSDTPHFELVDPSSEVTLVGDSGYVLWSPQGKSYGSTGSLRVRVTIGSTVEIITIPVRFY